MGITSHRRRPLNRTIPHLRDTKLVIIASEGSRTEKQYFENIFGRKSRRLQIHVLETCGGPSAPKHVLERLKDFIRSKELLTEDELWLVIDKDRWPDSQLHKVAKECRSCSFGLAVSRPCFELWLFLHFADVTPDMESLSSAGMKDRLRGLMGGYNPSKLDTQRFSAYYADARRRATLMDTAPDAAWPERLGTHVHKVINAIESLL